MTPLMRSFLLAATALLQAGAAQAQTPSISEATALRGWQAVAAALDAMGGTAAVGKLISVSRELEGTRNDVGQGPHPVAYQRVADRIGIPIPATSHPRITSIRELRTGRAVEHLRALIYGGQRLDARTIVTRDSVFSVSYDYVYHGIRSRAVASAPQVRIGLFRRYPESLLQAAWRRPEALRWIGRRDWEGRSHDAVAYADQDGTMLTLFFDEGSHLLSKVESLGEDGVLGDVTSDVVYDDYRPVHGVLFPFRYLDRLGGAVLQDLRATSLLVDAPLADSSFAHPTDFDEVPAPPPAPMVTLAENAYAMMGGYNSVVAVFDQYVVVVEAGGSPGAAEGVIARVHALAPGKPIRYVVSTHWNYDHLAGIRAYVAEGATIIAPPSARGPIEQAVASLRPLHPDALSRAPKQAIFEPLGSTKRVFSDGKLVLEVYDISPDPHADEMYIAWLPGPGVLFEADLLDLTFPGHAGTGGDDTAHLAAQIGKLGLAVERIVPVHGQIGSMADLRQALSRRP